jgi:hypothetical protein
LVALVVWTWYVLGDIWAIVPHIDLSFGEGINFVKKNIGDLLVSLQNPRILE